jgi:hypothetical protein
VATKKRRCLCPKHKLLFRLAESNNPSLAHNPQFNPRPGLLHNLLHSQPLAQHRNHNLLFVRRLVRQSDPNLPKILMQGMVMVPGNTARP